MGSTFYGLEIARKGLQVAMTNQQITSHNIANANTEGYTRQQGIQKSLEIGGSSGMYSANKNTLVGSGAQIQEIRQIRDRFTDFQYRKEVTELGEWEAKRDTLEFVEAVFNEPSDSGINSVLNEFFNSLQALSMNPEDPTTRATVQQKALALTENIRSVYVKLEDYQVELNEAIKANVVEINSFAQEIADLNEQIFRYEADGSNANDLRDQRNLLVDKLSKIVKVNVSEDNNGKFKVDVNGQILVSHFDYFTVTTTQRSSGIEGTPYPKNNIIDANDLVEVIWKNNGEKVNITGGVIKGYMDMRDGIGAVEEPADELIPPAEVAAFVEPQNNNTSVGIPYYMQKWNYFAHTLMTKFNEVHREGFIKDGTTNGINFFSDGTSTYNPDSPQQPVAKFITISDEIKNDWNNIATIYLDADDLANGINDPTQVEGNNKNVLRLLELRQSTGVSDCNNIDNYTKALISTLGVSSRQSMHMAENQELLVYEMENRRQSISGVSLDEEMSNMVKFQHAYNAAARVLTTMDEMLDIIIRNMGVVGR